MDMPPNGQIPTPGPLPDPNAQPPQPQGVQGQYAPPSQPLQPQQTPQQMPAPHTQQPAEPQLPIEEEKLTPYDFFMQPQGNQSTSRLSGAGSMSTKKLAIIVAVPVILIALIGAGLIAVLGKSDAPEPILAAAQTQNEIIRISTAGTKNARSDKLKNFAITAQSTMTSAQQQLLVAADKSKVKINKKALDDTKSATVDRALAAALTANTYDTTFSDTMKLELEKYVGQLTVASAAAPPKSALEAELKKQSGNAKLLQQQLLEQ